MRCLLVILTLLYCLGIHSQSSCNASDKKEPPRKAAEPLDRRRLAGTYDATVPSATSKPKNPVHQIDLPNIEPDFPPLPGRRTFIARCTVCHTLRYISMQPDFPEETWLKEVQKMRKTWHAHITDMEAKEIISYLTQVKGKKK